MSESLANELALLVAMTPMNEDSRTRYMSVIARVRRLELFVDEVAGNAWEDALAAESARIDSRVVFVDFIRGRV